MEKVLHRAHTRGGGEHGWLSTRYSFSFADWYDPKRMGFGALRVINDDTIAPSSGFGMHQHEDMEIITIVMSGTLTHRDSLGNTGMVSVGEIQAMSAGTGVTHSEYNDSPDTILTLFQIWIEPKLKGIAPRYAQKESGITPLATAGITALVAPDGSPEGLGINQDAYISYLVLDENTSFSYQLRSASNGIYLMVIEGGVSAAGETLKDRDAIGVWDTKDLEITSAESASVLLIEVPM